jgi:hypothetical protein
VHIVLPGIHSTSQRVQKTHPRQLRLVEAVVYVKAHKAQMHAEKMITHCYPISYSLQATLTNKMGVKASIQL